MAMNKTLSVNGETVVIAIALANWHLDQHISNVGISLEPPVFSAKAKLPLV
jgi:hypothetical protein